MGSNLVFEGVIVDWMSASVPSKIVCVLLVASALCVCGWLRPFTLGISPKIADIVAIGSALHGRPKLATVNCWGMKATDGWDWPNEIAVVTGGCSGIGHSIVKHLIARKVRVAVLDVQPLPEELAHCPLVRFYECNVTSRASVAKAANDVRSDMGHASILINNAGVARLLSIIDTNQEQLEETFKVNCMSHWGLVQEFLPHMIRTNRGHVMTVASMASFIALHKGADYSASKAAALSFHESLAMELKHLHQVDNVLTSVAHPSFVRTPMTRDIRQQAAGPMLDADWVGAVISRQIFKRRSAQMIIPQRYAPLCGMRGWPTWLQGLLRDYLSRAG